MVHIILESNSEGNQAERAVSFEPNKSVVNSRICPRYGNTRNNVSESTAGTFYEVGVRDKTPPGSILSCLQWYNSQLEILFKNVESQNTSFSKNGKEIYKQEIDNQQDCKNRHLFLSVYPLVKTSNVDNCLHYLCNFDVSPSDQGKDNESSDAKDADVASHPCLSFKFHNGDTELYCMSLGGSPVAKQDITTLAEQTNISHPIQPTAVGIWEDGNHVKFERPIINFTKTLDNEEDQQKIDRFLRQQRKTKPIMSFSVHGKITIDDLEIIAKDKWFTDHIINMYFWALDEQEKRRENQNVSFSLSIFSPF